ncbi:MAG: 2-C-methyl-D-erythritol 4-phosphate cytidylyltransferase, partial [Gammaproteobacteria bacterium]
MIGQNKLWGLIPAGGVGRRMDSDIPKQYLTLAGKSILQHSMERLLSLPDLDGLLVGISPTDEHWSDMSYCNDRLLGDYLAGEQRANT